MSIVGMFLGGAPNALIAAGQAVLNLQWQAENRADTPGASFTIAGPGFNQTVQAAPDGRTYITVPAGEYTVSVAHNGTYIGDEPLKVNAESQKSYILFFDGKVDQASRITALEKGKLDKDGKAVDSKHADKATSADKDGQGNNIADTYATRREITFNGSTIQNLCDRLVEGDMVTLFSTRPDTGARVRAGFIYMGSQGPMYGSFSDSTSSGAIVQYTIESGSISVRYFTDNRTRSETLRSTDTVDAKIIRIN